MRSQANETRYSDADIPGEGSYVLPLRLYISGVATRMDFAVDAIEDIKTAVSEACVLLLSDVTGGDMRIRC